MIAKRTSVKLTLDELCNAHLEELRSRKGNTTATTYRSRLVEVLAFAAKPAQRKYRYAEEIDREFVVNLSSHLHTTKTTRNGKAGGIAKTISAKQIRNSLETLRTILNWAKQPAVCKLPLDFVVPVTKDILPPQPKADPLRESPAKIEQRVEAISRMDAFELCVFGPSMLLAQRPDDLCGLLTTDVDWERRRLRFGVHFEGADHTKGRTSFQVVFPPELDPLLFRLVKTRTEGPLLLSAQAFANSARDSATVGGMTVRPLYEQALESEGSEEIQCDNDRKRVYRSVLKKLGGMTPDLMGKDFDRFRKREQLALPSIGQFRHAITHDMKQSGMGILELRYLTSHSTDDILNEYTSIDIVGAMEKYFDIVDPILVAIRSRGRELGLTEPQQPNNDCRCSAGAQSVHTIIKVTSADKFDASAQERCNSCNFLT
ncbi:phage integrase SAM-like domain-containing protein [Stratiformator vulcanicus]|nr:phage integrase SAM-like domain-containing protein [Stratiformator vulcanicus]